MVARRWFSHYVVIVIILTREFIHCNILHENEQRRASIATRKGREKSLLAPVIKPSKKLFATIGNQIKQVVNKLPNVFGRSSTPSARGGTRVLKPDSFGDEGKSLYIARRSEPFPRTETVYDVIDERPGFDDNVLKRDEIRRPERWRTRAIHSKTTNSPRRTMEQSLTEVYNDDGDYAGKDKLSEASSGDRELIAKINSSGSRSIDNNIYKNNINGNSSSNNSDNSSVNNNIDSSSSNNSDNNNVNIDSNNVSSRSDEVNSSNSNNNNGVNNNIDSSSNNNSNNNVNIDSNNISSRNDDNNNNNNNNSSSSVNNNIDSSSNNNSDNNVNIDNSDNNVNIDSNNISSRNDDDNNNSNNNNNNNYNSSSVNNNIDSSSNNNSDNNVNIDSNNISGRNDDDNSSNNNNYNNSSSNNNNNNSRNNNNNTEGDVNSASVYKNNNEESASSNEFNSLDKMKTPNHNGSTAADPTDEQFNMIKETVKEMMALESDSSKQSASPVNLHHWGQWLAWSACSKTCGNGVRMRRRTCRALVEGSGSCAGSSLETERCELRHCPVDGRYTDWTSWSSCSETCGQDSIQMRMRICMNPQPQYGGKDCPGSRFKIRYCTRGPCRDNLTVENENKSDNSDSLTTEGSSDDLLENLKAILRTKTANLEETLVTEPIKSASKLFDTIYQSGHEENTTSSEESQNSAYQTAQTTQTVENASTENATNFMSNDPPNTNLNETDNLTTSMSSFVDELKKLDNKLRGTETKIELDNKLKEIEAKELDDDLRDTKVATPKESSPYLLKSLGNGQRTEFGNLNVNGKVLNSDGKMSVSERKGKPELKNTENNIIDEDVDHSTQEDKTMNDVNLPSSSEIDKQNSIINGPVLTKTETISEKPSLNSEKPTLISEKPVLTSEKSELNSEEPVLNSEKPELNYEKPELNFEKSELNSEKSVLNSEKPVLNSEKPVLSSEKPVLTPNKPVLIPEKPMLNFNNESVSSSDHRLSDIMSVVHVSKTNHGNYPADHTHRKPDDISEGNNTQRASAIMGVIRYHMPESSDKANIFQNLTKNSEDEREWSVWSPCSKTCDRGYQTRNKKICLKFQPSEEFDCSHWKIQKRHCEYRPCHKILADDNPPNQNAFESNNLIPKKVTNIAHGATKPETEIFGLIRQELDADFLPWSLWSQCSASCDNGGVRSRTRLCKGKNMPNCIAPSYEKETCFVRHCAVNGAWSFWSDWTACSQTCGKSVKIRMRKCDSPAPAYGGENCEGHKEEHLKCDVLPCAVNGQWSFWSDWSKCSRTCGDGLQVRSRTCNNPVSSNGGLTCQGEKKEHLACHLQACPVDGGFSHWRPWSKCHKTCGENSFRTRFRYCNNPPPSDGGKSCHGDRLQVFKCTTKPCQEEEVDGGLSQWTSWSACSHSCGDTAVKSRDRFCNSPTPSVGGKNCTGQTFQIKLCEAKSCHKDKTIETHKKDEQKESSLVQMITDEKEQLLTDKKKGNKADMNILKRKLIENLKKLVPDLLHKKNDDEDKTIESKTNSEPSKVIKIKVSDHVERKRNSSSVEKIGENAASDLTTKIEEKEDVKDNQGNLMDSEDQSEDTPTESKEDIKDTNPIKSCGFNPCKLAKCLSDPFAACIPNEDCDPVYYDDAGNVKPDCSVETTFLTIPARQLCEHDPCSSSMCMNLPNAKCLTSALCHPVYFDELGNVFNCTGVLKSPVVLTCGSDPCIGKMCSTSPNAKCFTDFQCKSAFWNINLKEEISECRDPDDEQENADERSRTPTSNTLPSKKRSQRPWLRLSKAALNNIIRNSQKNGLYFPHAKVKVLSGKKKFRHSHRHLGVKYQNDDKDDDETDTDDDQTNRDDDQTNHNENENDNTGGDEIPFGDAKSDKTHFSLPNIPSNKLKIFNNPRKNPILTLTSLNSEQYQNQGGNGVGVSKDWKLKLKPPTNLDGYVESPQVYKINTLKHDGDQNTEGFLQHRKNDQELSPDGLPAEGLSSEGVSSEGLTSDGLSSERLTSEGTENPQTFHGGSVPSLNSVDRLLKADEAHQGIEETGDNAHPLLQGSAYDKVVKQDISDVANALYHADGSNTRVGGLSVLTSPEAREGLGRTLEDPVKESTLGLPDVEAAPAREGLPQVGETRGMIPGDISDTYKDDAMPDAQGGTYVPLDSVIDDLRADISRTHAGVGNPDNVDLGFR